MLTDFFIKQAKLVVKNQQYAITLPSILLSSILESGKKGITIQRFKGLGEMNADQLWETTLDPQKRTLLQIKVLEQDSTEVIFSTLMGDLVEPRRQFIQANALNVVNLDV
jgi:DNA gyrase subunit B